MIDIQAQPFESGIFGRAVGRLDLARAGDAGALSEDLQSAVRAWRKAGQWLVSCRVPEGSDSVIAALKSAGFLAVEVLVTLERPLDGDLPNVEAPEPMSPEDAGACVEIARQAFVHDRFHADPRIPKDGADELKAKWIENSFAGRADKIVVIRERNAPVGFCACVVRDQLPAIDLIATVPHMQGRGLGRRLVAGALAVYADRAAVMRVGTQAFNERSIRLYSAMGFAEVSRAHTLHWVNEDMS